MTTGLAKTFKITIFILFLLLVDRMFFEVEILSEHLWISKSNLSNIISLEAFFLNFLFKSWNFKMLRPKILK